MNFKTRIRNLERQISKQKKELSHLKALEMKSRQKWTKENRYFRKAAKQLARLKTFGTKKHKALQKKVDSEWDIRSKELTKQRDGFRDQIAKANETLINLGLELAKLKEQEGGEVKAENEVVAQVFALNEVVVRASKDLEDYLNRQVFPRLLDDDGKLLSQVSFTSADQLRRVRAMTNTMTIVRGDLATEAMNQIERFFDRFQKQAETMDPNSKALYDLTRQLLVEKASFKVGPDLYRFLAMELDEEIFPELAEAQRLLRLSIRSEKTTSYVRIHERTDLSGKWEPVRQSS
jgi:hypothetical protein